MPPPVDERDYAALQARVEQLQRELEAARAPQLMARTVLETAPAVILRVSLDLRIEYVNRVLPEYSGVQLIGQPVFAFAPPDQHAAMRTALEAAKATRLPSSFESIAEAPNGSLEWYYTTVGPILDGEELVGLTLICTNISRVKRAEEELHESRARLEFALDAGRLGLWSWDAIRDEVEWDGRMCTLFGLTPEQAPKTRGQWMALVPSDQYERMDEHIDRALRTGSYPDFELTFGTAASRRWFIVRAGPIHGPKGETTGLMGGVLEVTGLRLLEEQVRQTEKLEAIGQLSAGVAHNFNNMLAAIVPVLELARRRMPEADLSYVDGALESALHAAELVKELMVFSRRGRNAGGAAEPLDAVIRRAAELCRRTFEHRVRIDVGDLSAAHGVIVNGGRTEHALVNLLVNARDAVQDLDDARRTVTISTRTLAEAKARAIHDDANGDYVEVLVVDRGHGMDASTRARMFEPFFTTKPVGKGTGLGLPTAWAAARDQRGYLSCDSAPDVGTTFVLTLPAKCDDSGASVAPTSRVPARSRVLIIDDEPTVLESTALLLKMHGHHAVCASSGEEGVRMARSETIGVVLLDRSMPGQPAEVTLAQLRQLRPDFPVIAFSGLRDVLAGATVQLGKPATGQQLEQALEQALRTTSSARR